MITTIFTPTIRRGGLDVTAASIRRQKDVLGQLIWIVGDELFREREKIFELNAPDIPTIHFDTSAIRRQVPNLYRTLAHADNHALQISRENNADLMISLQDYIWIPEYGIRRFQELNQVHPNHIYTGLCSFSSDPGPEAVVNPDGLWSVFETPYKVEDKPQEISWHDVRDSDDEERVGICDPVWAEMNWSAIGKTVLYDLDIAFPNEYDEGVAYENQDYSFQAFHKGYNTVIDRDNHAISLNHKRYFPEEEAEHMQHLNQERHYAKWGIG